MSVATMFICICSPGYSDSGATAARIAEFCVDDTWDDFIYIVCQGDTSPSTVVTGVKAKRLNAFYSGPIFTLHRSGYRKTNL